MPSTAADPKVTPTPEPTTAELVGAVSERAAEREAEASNARRAAAAAESMSARRHAGYVAPREISRARRTYLAVWTLIAMLAGLVLVVAGFITHEDDPTSLLPLVLCAVGGAFETAVFATYLAEARR
jgi:hypothetical protein